MEYLSLEKINAYQKAYSLSNLVWDEVQSWEKFAKWSVGIQFVKAADSIAANIAEGFGRYYKKDKIQFYRYSFGSLEECIDWTKKAKYRSLLGEDEAKYFLEESENLKREINHLIKFANEKLKF